MLAKARTPFVLVISMVFVLAHGALSRPALAQTEAPEQAQEQSLPLEQLRTFVEILNRVDQTYVEPVSDKKMIENAIRGMINGLDPHSAYLDAEEFREMSVSTSGKFGGLGIQVQMQNGFVRVISPIDDTPAARAGIQAGDLIVRIDGKPVKGMSLNDAVTIMRGEPGSKISLTILRDGREKPLQVELTRAIVRVESVNSRMLEPGFGYLRITQFSSETPESLIDAIQDLKSESEQPLEGVVLDLRNNPGGVLDAAADVSDVFLENGVVVSIKGRTPQSTETFTAGPGDRLQGVPIVVLINGGTASAAEIVAGALQDQNRAVIVGTRSFGKGSVQTVVPLQSGAAIKLTTARYYTPSGRSIQAEGIAPDIIITPLNVTVNADAGLEQISEADLVGRLDNGTASPEGDEAEPGEAQPDLARREGKLAEQDYQLYEALNLLKGLVILEGRS